MPPGEFSEQLHEGNYTFWGLRPMQIPTPGGFALAVCAVRNNGLNPALVPPVIRGGYAFHTWRWYNAGGAVDAPWLGHRARTNLAFADGHGERADPARLARTSNYSPHPEMGHRGIDAYWDADGVYVDRYGP
jgi:prepilin-type processing-associated H-X9-DG protein